MNGYILSIIGTILLCAFLTAIAPEGRTSAVIRGVAKLACLIVIVAPIPQLLYSKKNDKTGQDFFSQTVIETDADFIKYYSEMRISSMERALEEEIYEEFCVKSSVSLAWEYPKTQTEDIKITKITVRTETLSETEVLKRMSEYLTLQYCSEVLIE